MPYEQIPTTEFGTTVVTTRALRRDGQTDSGSATTVNPSVQKWITRTWTRTPNFVQLKRLGQLPDNDFSYRQSTEVYPRGSVVQVVDDGNWWQQDVVSGLITDAARATIPVIDPKKVQNADDLARTKVLGNLKDISVNIAQMIAEREQTLNLLITSAIRIAKAASHLKRGDIAGAAGAMGTTYSRKKRKRYHDDARDNPTRAASQAWLELQYGWKPLLSDVYGLAEAAGKAMGPELRSKVRGSGSQSASSSEVIYGSGFARAVDKNYTVTCKYTVKFSTSNSSFNLAKQIGLTNPALLAWELLPFSFVVDWFLPIGNWANTFDATVGLTFAGGTKTVVTEMVTKQTETRSVPKNASGFVKSIAGIANSSIVLKDIQRMKLSEFPGPGLPTFKNPVSPVHAANALSLLAVIFGRR